MTPELEKLDQIKALNLEISTLTRERDVLSKENKDLTASNSDMVSTLSENSEVLTKLKSDHEDFINLMAKETVEHKEEVASLISQKSTLKESICELSEILMTLNANMGSLNDHTRNIAKSVNEIGLQVSNTSAHLGELTGRAVDALSTAEIAMKAATVESEEILNKIADKHTTLEKRESYLNEREAAIDELNKKYVTGGIKLNIK